MRRFLICGGVHGQPRGLEFLEACARRHRPDAVLFAGGVLGPDHRGIGVRSTWGLRQADVLFIEHFFETLGRLNRFCAVISGALDGPRDEFLRQGMHAELEYPGVHLAHATLLERGDTAICGMGGALSAAASYELDVSSRIEVEYHLRSLWTSTRPYKVALLRSPSTGRCGGTECDDFTTELADSYHPDLFVVGSHDTCASIHRVARTLIVHPGRLAQGAAVLVDRDRPRGEQAQLLGKHRESLDPAGAPQ